MRPIDADALIARLEEDAEQMEDPIAAMFTYGAINDIKHEPTITVPQWIPVSERLPETHKTGNSISGIFMQSKPVLVYGVPEYERDYGFHVVVYCDDLNGVTYWSTELDAVTINKVTAWMPLPEPYKGGAADERPED